MSWINVRNRRRRAQWHRTRGLWWYRKHYHVRPGGACKPTPAPRLRLMRPRPEPLSEWAARFQRSIAAIKAWFLTGIVVTPSMLSTKSAREVRRG